MRLIISVCLTRFLVLLYIVTLDAHQDSTPVPIVNPPSLKSHFVEHV